MNHQKHRSFERSLKSRRAFKAFEGLEVLWSDPVTTLTVASARLILAILKEKS